MNASRRSFIRGLAGASALGFGGCCSCLKCRNGASKIRLAAVGVKGESYRPEIVNCYFHKPDAKGWATVKQVYPDKKNGVFVKYRPSELPYATRWIARTVDEDAMGMCLPATCEHKGRIFARKMHEERFLAPGKTFTLHVETGIL